MQRIKKKNLEEMDIDRQLRVLLCKIGHLMLHAGGGKLSQGRILSIISENGSVAQSDLQEYLDVRASSLSEILKKLDDNKLIRREYVKDDHRKIIINLEDKGYEEALKQKRICQEENRLFFEVLSDDEKEELAIILKKLIRNIRVKT